MGFLSLVGDMLVGMAAQTAVSLAVTGMIAVPVFVTGGLIGILAFGLYRETTSEKCSNPSKCNVIPFPSQGAR